MKKQELIIVTPEERSVHGIEKITAFIEMAKKIEEQAKAIVVKDDGTMTIADNLTKNAKKLKADLEKKKKEITEDWRTKTALVNDLTKRIMEPIESAISIAGNNVVSYKTIKEKERQKELEKQRLLQQKMDQFLTDLERFTPNFIEELSEVTSNADLDIISKKYVSTNNEFSVYNILIKTAEEIDKNQINRINSIRAELMKLGKAKRQELSITDEKKKEELSRQIEKMQSHVQEKVIAESAVADNEVAVKVSASIKTLANEKTSGIRKLWRHKVIDINLVPIQYLSVNAPLIVEHIKSHKAEDGSIEPIPGIEFYQESVHVS